MAQKEEGGVYYPLTLIGMEYRIPGIKESPIKRAFFCILASEYRRRLTTGEGKTLVTELFKIAFQKLLAGTTLECDGCGKKRSVEAFFYDPFDYVCKASVECKQAAIKGRLIEKRNESAKELEAANKIAIEMLKEPNVSSSNHPADQNEKCNAGNDSRRSNLEKLINKCDEAVRMIEEGTYGLCEECGEEICEGRLLVAPNATLCVTCKTEQENSSKIPWKGGGKVSPSRTAYITN